MKIELPENKRKTAQLVDSHKLWIYGAPFSGKTTLANQFPDPFILNTDGNTKYIDAPSVLIADEVEVNGRMADTTLAWDIFKAYVDLLAQKQNTFKTIVVDLVEDMYEHCRQYIYREMGISHESEDSFRAWDRVRTEFLAVMKKLMTLDYDNIILISQEDISRDITKKSGDKITAIKPNINDKVALKLAGMVDVVIRAVTDDDTYRLTFKSDSVVFGGGRIKLNVKEIDNSYPALMKALEHKESTVTVEKLPATESKTEPVSNAQPYVEPKTETLSNPEPEIEVPQVDIKEDAEETAPVKRRRRRSANEDDAPF